MAGRTDYMMVPSLCNLRYSLHVMWEIYLKLPEWEVNTKVI
jgi:hypothetical protein